MRTKVFMLLPLTGLAVAMIGVPASQGADPFVAGGPSTRTLALDLASSDRARERGMAVGRILGLGGSRQTVTRLDDRFDHRTYDEVVTFDARGREVGLTRIDPDGGLRLAIRLGWAPGPGRPVAAAAAADKAVAIARSLGLAASGTPEVHPSQAAGGWIVRWPRVVDGVAVRGDGLRVSLWADGSFHALSAEERPLAGRPAAVMTADAARSIAQRIVGARFAASADSLAVVAVEQAWVAPNDTWDPARPDAPDATLRLAWVVRLQSRGTLAERMRMLEFWLDAGDGNLIGGDIAE